MDDFKFRLPSLTELNRVQTRAVMEERAVLLNGVPGTGKTTVMIFRLLQKLNLDQNVIMLTYGKLLAASIQRTSNVNTSVPSDKISSIHSWSWRNYTGGTNLTAFSLEELRAAYGTCSKKFEEILIDEGQDIYEKVFRSLDLLSDKISVGSDSAQSIYPHGTSERKISEILGHQAETFLLDKNYRNTKEVYSFARLFAPNSPRAQNINISELRRGDMPEVMAGLDLPAQLQRIELIISNNVGGNIGILLERTEDVDWCYDYLNSAKIKSSKYYYRSQLTNLKRVLVTTYNSCKGMEFDVVIMPKFENARKSKSNLYYVGATRTVNNLYILCSNEPVLLTDFKDTYK